MKTIHTIRWFNEDSDFFSEMPDYVSKFPKHCVKDSKGARFMNQTAPAGFENGSFAAYIDLHESRLDELMGELDTLANAPIISSQQVLNPRFNLLV